MEGTQARSLIRGVAKPGAEIEAVNLSVNPAEGMRLDEGVVIARADENGNFVGRFPMRSGDIVRVRAYDPSGIYSKSVTVRARGIGGRPRPVHVEMARIGLRDLGNGRIRILNLSPRRPIAQADTVIRISNRRTGEHVSLTMNYRGAIAGRPTIAGAAGDVLRIDVEGKTLRRVGKLVTPSPSKLRGRGLAEVVHPNAYHQSVGFVPALQRFRAPLFERRPRAFDVFQSELANCYIASAVAAVAHVRPESLARVITRVSPGVYRVRFRALDPRTGKFRTRSVTVTSDLYVRPSGGLLYGSTTEFHAAPFLWWPILEKAFARLRGSYREIGRGGCSDKIFERLLGRPGRRFFIDPNAENEPERVWQELRAALEAKRPVVAGTGSPMSARKYRNTGLVADHAYTVLACRPVGRKLKIAIRNPWGESARRPGKVRRNGLLEVDLDQFVRLFDVVSTVR